MKVPPALERLVQALSLLPGVGEKTAQRLAFSILRWEPERAQELAQAVGNVQAQVTYCPRCFSFANPEAPQSLCPICADPTRNAQVVCVVEQPADVYVIERSGAFGGRYHVLLGAISPLDGIGPEQLKIAELLARLEPEGVEELILATNPSIQGEATGLYIQRMAGERVKRMTRLARGMPVGANLEFTDDVTLSQAFSGRRTFGAD